MRSSPLEMQSLICSNSRSMYSHQVTPKYVLTTKPDCAQNWLDLLAMSNDVRAARRPKVLPSPSQEHLAPVVSKLQVPLLENARTAAKLVISRRTKNSVRCSMVRRSRATHSRTPMLRHQLRFQELR